MKGATSDLRMIACPAGKIGDRGRRWDYGKSARGERAHLSFGTSTPRWLRPHFHTPDFASAPHTLRIRFLLAPFPPTMPSEGGPGRNHVVRLFFRRA